MNDVGGNLINYLSLYATGTTFDIEEGQAYYDRLHEAMATIGEHYGVSTSVAVGAFTALSPNLSESTNYLGLEGALNHVLNNGSQSYPGYPRNRVKAHRIIRGEDPMDVLRGDKVTAFYNNIMTPNVDEWITIDGHMFNAWTNKLRLLKSGEMSSLGKYYPEAKQDLLTAASLLGVTGPRMQSTLWHLWKKRHGIIYKQQQSFKWEFIPLYPAGPPAQK